MQYLRFVKIGNASLRQSRPVRNLAVRSGRRRFTPSFDPYTYSQGHWLDRDDERREARRLRFSFNALLDVALKHSKGAREVVACEKKEGGFNRVFIIKFDDGAKVVAKVPLRFAGPSRLTTMSEVATLKYVRNKTCVPVPQVLAWSSEVDSGLVRSEYIIMEFVSGVALKDVWDQMTEIQHIELIETMAKMLKELCALNFGTFGSLFLNTADKPGGTLPVDEEYCIGPHCGRHVWGYNDDLTSGTGIIPGAQGPWQHLSAFFADLTRIAESTIARRESSQELIEDHLRILEVSKKILQLVQKSTAIQNACKPLLFHPDLHARNIFVDRNNPTQVLSVIDWQCTAIEPAFVHARETPDFAEELMLDKILDTHAPSEVHEAQAHAQRCKIVWRTLTSLCSKLGQAMSLDHYLCRYLASVSSGFSDDIFALQSLLLDVSQKWDDLGLSSVCPYQPSQKDTRLLDMELDQSDSRQRLRLYLSRLLRCDTDGWVEQKRWDEVVPIYRKEYAEFVEACVASREIDETEEDAKEKADKLWPFDLR